MFAIWTIFYIMSPIRWKLRHAIRRLNQIFHSLGLRQHPDKTFIGKIEKGFDLLGYHFTRECLTLANKTVSNFEEHLHRLYDQQKTAPEGGVVLGEYVPRWQRWTQAGLGGLFNKITFMIEAESSQAKGKKHHGSWLGDWDRTDFPRR